MIAVLDYILSKMVLLIFLLLLVSAFALVQQSLNSYFTQQAANGLASGISSHISQVVTTVRSTSERKVFVMPPALEAGNEKIPYDVNVAVYRRSDGQHELCYVGVLVLEQGTGKPLAFDAVPVGKPGDVDIHVCYRDDGIFARSSGVKDQYLILDRTIDLANSQMSLTLCSSTHSSAQCSSCEGDLC